MNFKTLACTVGDEQTEGQPETKAGGLKTNELEHDKTNTRGPMVLYHSPDC